MAKDKRVEVLFEEKAYSRLEEAARARKQSVGSLVREAVAKYVVHPTEDERQRAFDHFLSLEGHGGPVGTPEEIKRIITDSQYIEILKSMNDPALAGQIQKLEEDLEALIRDIETR